MNKNRVSSAPDRVIRSGEEAQQRSREYTESYLVGVAAHVKLLLKMIKEHNDATDNNRNEGKKMLRVAAMLTIIENVRIRILSSQIKRTETDLIKGSSSNSDVHSDDDDDDDHLNLPIEIDEEREKLRKDLTSTLSARRSLQIFCTTLGRERDFMSSELSRKVNLMNAMEEFVTELEEENQSLSNKIRNCVYMHLNSKAWLLSCLDCLQLHSLYSEYIKKD